MRERPVYLNLFTFAYPVTAIVSILHRLSGLLLFLLIPSLLLLLQNIISYPEVMVSYKFNFCLKAIIWLGMTGFIYHLVAGIRHIIMDTGYAEKLPIARASSYAVLIITVICSLLVGVKLW